MKKILTLVSFLIITNITSGQSESQTDKLHPNDFKNIFQLALDFPQLQQYYHADTDTSRKQIIFQDIGKANHNSLKGVVKFGRQVIMMTENELKQRHIKNYFVLGDWVCGDNSVRLQLSYVGEGLTISYVFKKENDKWKIVNSDIWEE